MKTLGRHHRSSRDFPVHQKLIPFKNKNLTKNQNHHREGEGVRLSRSAGRKIAVHVVILVFLPASPNTTQPNPTQPEWKAQHWERTHHWLGISETKKREPTYILRKNDLLSSPQNHHLLAPTAFSPRPLAGCCDHTHHLFC